MRLLLFFLLTTWVWAGPSERLFLAVETAGDQAYLEPIAFRRAGRWVTPTPDSESRSMGQAALQLIDRYFAPNASYSLVGGGQVRVKNSDSARALAQEYANGGGGAWSLAAEAVTTGMTRPRGLALDFELSTPRSTPQAADQRQRSRFLKIFRSGPGKSLAWKSRSKVSELWGVDLDQDGSREWLGTIQGGPEHQNYGAFMLLGAKGQVLLSRRDESAQSWDFLDHVDADGDGLAELFFRHNGEGGYGFSIFQKVQGRWKETYSGGGGGC